MSETKIRIKDLAPLIRCLLCKGLIVDATTITECLHTFCKTCIVKYLQKHTRCPNCESLIHQSYPLDYISHDRTIQDIVSKIFPNLKSDQEEKERIYYLQHPKQRNPTALRPTEKKSEPTGVPKSIPSVVVDTASDCHRNDDQLSVQLECKSRLLRPLKRRYLRCSSQTTVLLLKKFIAVELFDDMSRFNELDILCNDELLGPPHSLMFVQLTRWRYRDPPLVLHYRQREEIG